MNAIRGIDETARAATAITVYELAEKLYQLPNPRPHDDGTTEIEEGNARFANLHHWAETMWGHVDSADEQPTPERAVALAAAHLADMVEFAIDNPWETMDRPSDDLVLREAEEIVAERQAARDEATRGYVEELDRISNDACGYRCADATEHAWANGLDPAHYAIVLEGGPSSLCEECEGLYDGDLLEAAAVTVREGPLDD